MMKCHIVRNCLKSLSIRTMKGQQAQSRMLLGTLTADNTPGLPIAVIFRSCRRHYTSKLMKNKTPVSKIDTMNERYLNYMFVSTSTERWIEFVNGIVFDVGIFDSSDSKIYNNKIPVILGIPGCLGTHEDLLPYLSTFIKVGYRVIIPNLPGTKYCKGRSHAEEHIFTMSVSEKAEFIRDTLAAIGIPCVDMVVTHSDSVHLSLELTSGTAFKLKAVKSLVLLDPMGLQYTESMQPLNFYKRLSKIIETKSHLTSVLRLFLTVGKKLSEKKRWTADEIMLYARNIGALSLEESNLNAQRYKGCPVPLRVFYSDVGSSIDIPSTEELLETMGVQISNKTVCDENGHIVSEGTVANNQQCFYFTSGQTSEGKLTLIRTELLKFLKTVRPDILEL